MFWLPFLFQHGQPALNTSDWPVWEDFFFSLLFDKELSLYFPPSIYVSRPPGCLSENVTATFWLHFYSRTIALGGVMPNWITSSMVYHARKTFAWGFVGFLPRLFLFWRQKGLLCFPSPLPLTASVNHCVAVSGRAEGNNTHAPSMGHFKLSPCLIKPGTRSACSENPPCGRTHSWMKVYGKMWARWGGLKDQDRTMKTFMSRVSDFDLVYISLSSSFFTLLLANNISVFNLFITLINAKGLIALEALDFLYVTDLRRM